MNFYFCDIETNALKVREVTKIHCLSFLEMGKDLDQVITLTDYEQIKDFIFQDDICLIGHNFWLYDIRTLEEFFKRHFNVKSSRIIDTLAMSWYFFPNRLKHGLDSWGEDVGIAKVSIEDWEGLPLEEYVRRCEEDVKITASVFNSCIGKAREIYQKQPIKDIIRYLNQKMYHAYVASRNPFGLDIELAEAHLERLEGIYESSYRKLEQVLPPVPRYKKKKRPKVTRKKDGTLNTYGQNWLKLLQATGTDLNAMEVKYLAGTKPPNAASSEQIKEWLFSLGWEPCTHKDGANGPVPQIRIDSPSGNGKELAPSVKLLAKKEPVILELEQMTVAKHRADILRGFIKNSFEENGRRYVVADIAGFTKTLRFKHSTIVNLPKAHKAFGETVRSVLIAPDPSTELVGSDVSSLEDSTKQHYIFPFDPEYVAEMQAPGYDPHLGIGVFAKLITQDQCDFFKWYKDGQEGSPPEEFHELSQKEKETLFEKLGVVRGQAKQVNFSAVYGVGKRKLAKVLGISQKEAAKLLNAYWGINWSVKKFASTIRIRRVGTELWVLNPVNQFWYFISYEKDIFSAINQSTGAFLFDQWLDNIIAKYPRVCGQFHDEFIAPVPKGVRESCTHFVEGCMQQVNEKFQLNVNLKVDVQYGDSYIEIH